MLFLKKRWNSSVNALLLILMVMLGLYLFDDNIGLFATLSTIFGSAENAVRESNVPQIQWSWQLGLFIGVFFGSFCGALINNSFKFVWALEGTSGFSGKVVKSVFYSLVSGFLVMLGAIMAGDVLFGQIAAVMQLSSSACFFVIVTLISAGITALFIERRSGSSSTAKKAAKEDE